MSTNRRSNYPDRLQGNSFNFHGRQSNFTQREPYERGDRDRGLYQPESKGYNQNYDKPNNSLEIERERFSTGSDRFRSASKGKNQNYKRPEPYHLQQSNEMGRKRFATSEQNILESKGSSQHFERQDREIGRERFPASSQPYWSESKGYNQNNERFYGHPEKQYLDREREMVATSSDPCRAEPRENKQNYEKISNYQETKYLERGRRGFETNSETHRFESRRNNPHFERQSNPSENQSLGKEGIIHPASVVSQRSASKKNFERPYYPERQSREIRKERMPASSGPYRSELRGNSQHFERSSYYPNQQSSEIEKERFLYSSDPHKSESRGDGQNFERPSYYPDKQSHEIERDRFPASSGPHLFESRGNSQNFERRPSCYPDKQSHGRESYEKALDFPEKQCYEIEKSRYPASFEPRTSESRMYDQTYDRSENYSEQLSHERETGGLSIYSQPPKSEQRGNRQNYDQANNYPEKQFHEKERFPSSAESYNRNESRLRNLQSERPSNYREQNPYDRSVSSSSVYGADSYERRVYLNPSTRQEKRSSDREKEHTTSSSKYFKQEADRTLGSLSDCTLRKSIDIKREVWSPSIKSETNPNQDTGFYFESLSNYPKKETFVVKKEFIPSPSNSYGTQMNTKVQTFKSETDYRQQQLDKPLSKGKDFSALFDVPEKHGRDPKFDARESNINLRHKSSDKGQNPFQPSIAKGRLGNRLNDERKNNHPSSETKSGNINYRNDSRDQSQRKLEQKVIQKHSQPNSGIKSNFQENVEQTSKKTWYEETCEEYQWYEEICDTGDVGQYGDKDHCEDKEPNEDIDQDQEAVVKNTVLYSPSKEDVSKYRFYPPSPEQMANMFKDLVIFFLFKTAKVKLESNPFVIICESFRRSSSYHNLGVQDGFSTQDRNIRFCTLRYCEMMMVRGMSSFGITKEARVKAGVTLINNLSQLCYTLKMKPDYYNNDGLKRHLAERERPGVFRVIPEEELPKERKGIKELVERFFQVDTDCELIFTCKQRAIIDVAKELNLHSRKIGKDCTGVSKVRTTQYWRDLLLSEGQMENEKFVLIPPQGIGKQLITGSQLNDILKPFKKRMVGPAITEDEIKLYGPKGEGPTIQVAKVSWCHGRRGKRGRGGGRGRGRGKSRGRGKNTLKRNKPRMNN